MCFVGDKLGQPLEVIESMSSEEFDIWCAYYSYVQEEEKRAHEKAKRGRKR